MSDKIVVPNKIKYYRNIKKMKQRELAEIVGLHRSYVARHEVHELHISPSMLQKYVRAFNVKPWDIVDLELYLIALLNNAGADGAEWLDHIKKSLDF